MSDFKYESVLKQKSEFRLRLEKLENEVRMSWIRDWDRSSELKEIVQILSQMLEANDLEAYFQNRSDLDYFVIKFSKEVASDILKQPVVFGENGDDIALQVLSSFLLMAIKFSDNPKTSGLLECASEILDSSKPFYKGTTQFANMKVSNPKKQLSFAKFNESLPMREVAEFNEGDFVDVLIDNSKLYLNLNDKKVWVRGIVEKVNTNHYVIYTIENSSKIYDKKSLDIVTAGEMTKDYEWRTSLQVNDVIDSHDRGRWYPASILKVFKESSKGIMKVDYSVGFRLYTDTFPQFSSYLKCWNRPVSITLDRFNRKYVGDNDQMDELISCFSKRIQPFNSQIIEKRSIDQSDSYIDDRIKFEYEQASENGSVELKKTYIIGKGTGFCYYYALLLKEFAENGGFNYLLEKCKTTPNPDNIHNTFMIFGLANSYFHNEYLKTASTELYKCAKSYIDALSTSDSKGVKKETIDLVVRVLKQSALVSKCEPKFMIEIEDLYINYSIKFIKSPSLDKRIQAVKTLVDIIKTCRFESDKKEKLLEILKENKIFSEIFGSNSHIQLINKSQELLELMIQEDKVTESEFEQIWSATQKGDLDSKLSILKILKEVSRVMRPDHIEMLLHNILQSKTADIIVEELELMVNLSAVSKESNKNLGKCCNYLLNYAYTINQEDPEKLNFVISKIVEIAGYNDNFLELIIKTCLVCLDPEIGKDTSLMLPCSIEILIKKDILALKILSKFIGLTNFRFSKPFRELLLENNVLSSTFKKNWILYKQKIIENQKSNGIVGFECKNDCALLSQYSLKAHNKYRLEFLTELINEGIWSTEEGVLDFLINVLLENQTSDTDSRDFYNYIKLMLTTSKIQGLEENLFSMFHRIYSSSEDCLNIGSESFNILITVFYTINQNKGKIVLKNEYEDQESYKEQQYIYGTANGGANYSLNLANQTDQKKQNESLYTYCTIENPESLEGFDLLWRIVFNSKSEEIMNKGINILFNLFANVKPEKKEAQLDFNNFNLLNEEEIVINENKVINMTNQLFEKCVNLIIEASNPEKSSISNNKRKNLITKGLKFLELIIEESEKEGNSGLKSHSALLKKGVIDITISFLNQSLELKIFENTTVWELKEIVAQKLEVNSQFLKLFILPYSKESKNFRKNEVRQNNAKLLSGGSYGKTVIEVGLKLGDEIRAVLNNEILDSIPKTQLYFQGKINTEFLRIINEWFTIYSNEDKMQREHCANFIWAATGQKDPVTPSDTRVSNIFDMYDRTNLGYISREEFNRFYQNSLLNMEKVKAVWENLVNFKYRNDLKKMSVSLENTDIDKSSLPRFILSHNELFFNTLFKVHGLDNEISKRVFEFLSLLCTNPTLYKYILTTEDTWFDLGNDSNFKIIYSLQIVESFLEDIELDKQNVDYYKSEDLIADKLGGGECKENWVENFMRSKGFEALFIKLSSLIEKKIAKGENSDQDSTEESILFELILKIIKLIFYWSLSLNSTSKVYSVLESEVISKDYSNMTSSLIELLQLMLRIQVSNEQIYLIENLFEFLLYILSSQASQTAIMDSKYIQFKEIVLGGIFNDNALTRIKFGECLAKILQYKHLEKAEKLKVTTVTILSEKFTSALSCCTTNDADFLDSSEQFFSLLINFLSDYLVRSDNSKAQWFDIGSFYERIVVSIEKEISHDKQNSSIFSIRLLTGQIRILSSALDTCNEVVTSVVKGHTLLLQDILTKLLFKSVSISEIQQQFSEMKFVERCKFSEVSLSKCKDPALRDACYSLVLSLINNSVDNIMTYLQQNANLNDKKEDDYKSLNSHQALNARRWNSISLGEKREGHVGIRNLGCICYMNSMLQQFFMTQSFRYNLLAANDNKPSEKINVHGVDDNPLHQVQRMFTFLDLSDKEDYNPSGFCYSFKDWDGNSVNTSVQQDSQEFLNRFFDTIEERVKQTPFKYLVNSVYGGKTCSQIICEQGCGKMFNRYEIFNSLSLEVKNHTSLDLSLEKLIVPEKIDNYFCETCQKKVTITKRNSLAELPNVLIIYLSRLAYNYDLERNEKINSRLEFPRELNLKKYSIEDLTRKMNESKDQDQTEKNDNPEIYFKSEQYYDYDLVGVNVHLGSADAGHYFSYINKVRGGVKNMADYDRNNPEHRNDSWLKFNDSNISKFNIEKLEEECFGGTLNKEGSQNYYMRFHENIQSGYMLVYERKFKNPLKTVVSETEAQKNQVIAYKEEDQIKILADTNLLSETPTNDSYAHKEEQLLSSIYHDIAKNEYYCFQPFYSESKMIPKEYFLEVIEDNLNFQRQKTASDASYQKFIEAALKNIQSTLTSFSIEDQTPEFLESINSKLLDFTINFSSNSDKKSILISTILHKLLKICEQQPALAKRNIDYLYKCKTQIYDMLISDEEEIVEAFSSFIYGLVKSIYGLCEGKIIESNNKTDYENYYPDSLVKICDMVFIFFSKIPRNSITSIYPIYTMFLDLLLLGDEMVEYFVSKQAITLFVTYLIGRESPYLREYIDREYYNPGMVTYKIEHLVQAIFIIFKRSTDYKNSCKNNSSLSGQFFEISEKDSSCIRNAAFIRNLYKAIDSSHFTEFVVTLLYDNESLTYQICQEILTLLDQIRYHDFTDMSRFVTSIIPILGIEDAYQRVRFEIILGYPQLIFEDPNERHKFNVFGYRKVSDPSNRWLEIKCPISSSILVYTFVKRLYNSSNDKSSFSVFEKILQATTKNAALLKYLYHFNLEEAYPSTNFIESGLDKMRKWSNSLEVEELYKQIKLSIASMLADSALLPNFNGFLGNFMPADVKREEIEIIKSQENIHLLRITYYTNYHYLTKDLIFDKKNLPYAHQFTSGLPEEPKLRQIDSAQNLEGSNSNLIIIDPINRKSDREFFSKVSNYLKAGKIIIVQDKYEVSNFTLTAVRYVVLNDTRNEAEVSLKFCYKSIENQRNEFLPSSAITYFVSCGQFKNFLILQKIDPTKDFTSDSDIDFDFSIAWSKDSYYPRQ